jgi:hypothetical protein
MPLYPGVAQAITPSAQVPLAVYPGCTAYLFGVQTDKYKPIGDNNVTGESPTSGQASISVALASAIIGSLVRNVGVELIFNGNPGAANFQIQESDTDADGMFVTPSPAAFTVTTFTQVGTNWIARVDIGTIGSKFVRILASANPNSATVTVIAKINLN